LAAKHPQIRFEADEQAEDGAGKLVGSLEGVPIEVKRVIVSTGKQCQKHRQAMPNPDRG
jgi:hypothetical protein